MKPLLRLLSAWPRHNRSFIPISYRLILISYRFHTDVIPISYRCHTDFILVSYRFHTGLIRYEVSISVRSHTDFIPISYRFHIDFILISYRCHTGLIGYEQPDTTTIPDDSSAYIQLRNDYIRTNLIPVSSWWPGPGLPRPRPSLVPKGGSEWWFSYGLIRYSAHRATPSRNSHKQNAFQWFQGTFCGDALQMMEMY